MTDDKAAARQRSAAASLIFAAQSGAWIVREAPDARKRADETAPPPDLPMLSQPLGGELALIREELGDCTRCRLHLARTHIVFGVGNEKASLVFVGEGPGEEEDKRGEPFVGRAGRLLDRMISAMGFGRPEIYIANVVKCRPPKNRDPAADEVETCFPFLEKQLAAIKPRVVVALGSHSAKALLNSDEPVGKLRGKIHKGPGYKVVVTYHPAYLLRNPSAKELSWQDLKTALAVLNEAEETRP